MITKGIILALGKSGYGAYLESVLSERVF